jgi:TRAP-type C4-dicarboxylate transport system permease small subunit
VSLGQTSAALGVSLAWVYSALPISGFLIAWFSLTRIRHLLREKIDA